MAKEAKDQEKELATEIFDLTQKQLASWNEEEFFKELMRCYGTADRSVEQCVLNDRSVNVASEIVDDTMSYPDLAIRQRAYFRFLKHDEDVSPALEKVKDLKEVKSDKNRIQFIICASAKNLALYDLGEDDTLYLNLEDLPDHYSFLLPIKEGRREKVISTREADKKACLKLTRLLDALAKFNNLDSEHMKQLNVFIRRVLFCFFAEDTNLFDRPELPAGNNKFTNAFNKFVGKHGEGAEQFFRDLFLVLDTKDEDRVNIDHPIDSAITSFPYVNGGLFRDSNYIPKFDLSCRNLLLDCGKLQWKEISPAVFGAMFQGAMNKEDRRTLGAHYTSEENILKIIKPLFLDHLYAQFEELKLQTKPLLDKIEALPFLKNKRSTRIWSASYDFYSQEQLKIEEQRRQVFYDFLARIGRLKFLDPACGCGNFLLIAYRELRKLENEVFNFLGEGSFTDSYISINQFYGIEIEDWPAEIAHVSMWLMQHLMNQETNARFGAHIQSIPLKTSATIVNGNALTIDWNDVIPAKECSYILGNPPFGGTTFTTAEQKEWLKNVYPPKYKLGLADFVTAWFVKAADYMRENHYCQTAFVSTNSICQGEQVATLWGLLLDKGIHINFAYSSFPWTNDASNKAVVTCVIVGFGYVPFVTGIYKYINKEQFEFTECQSISPYLTASEPMIIKGYSKSLSAPINLVFGNKAADGGHLIFTYQDGQEFLKNHPEAQPFVKKFIGSSELMKGEHRYCLWLKDEERDAWSAIPAIAQKVEECRQWRSAQTKTGDAFKLQDKPWSFRSQFNPLSALVIPAVTSEKRYYVPIELIKQDTIVSNACFLVPEATNYDFAILTSRMHMVWMRLTSGKLESRYRYSRDLTYNTFIWPEVNDEQKDEITRLAKNIRRCRAMHPTMCLGELYNPDTMPQDLKDAHNALDLAVEKLYRDEPFSDDEERLSFMLNLYSKAVAKEGK